MTHPGLLITTHEFLIPHGTLNEGLSNFWALPLFMPRMCEEQDELKTNNYNNQSVLKRYLTFLKLKMRKNTFGSVMFKNFYLTFMTKGSERFIVNGMDDLV